MTRAWTSGGECFPQPGTETGTCTRRLEPVLTGCGEGFEEGSLGAAWYMWSAVLSLGILNIFGAR